MCSFSHLHLHTQFSLLDGASDISKVYKKAIANNMPGVAITDHGNMFGVFQFVAEAYKHKGEDGKPKVKPIVGCEFYLVADRHRKNFTREDRDVRYHQLLLAKNETGYKNLTKLCSLGFMDGYYSKYPRIDKELILKYHEGLIATTCCIGAEVPKAILKKGEKEAEEVFKWWLDLFGEDYYVELQRHNIKEQNIVNEVLLRFAEKYNVKVIASNDAHYIDQKDANAHDILLCINTGEKKSTPSMKEFTDDEGASKGMRFAFANDQFYFKTPDEMATLFADLPQAIDNTNEIVDKVELLDLNRNILLPNFPVPPEFADQMAYLEYLTFDGAKKRYGEITQEVEERLNFELHTIRTMGFAGYFLIVADFIKAGRDLGVFVGPGRGSAAGSAVAYCIGITNIDPIKYDLLFERFLNPERKSMPDIDTDFDDEGRQKVIDYVVDKYGRNQVAQIVTYGTMAAKMSIKDVARVLDLPLEDSNYLTKLVPERPGIKLERIFNAPLDGEKSLAEKEGLGSDELVNIKQLRQIAAGNDLKAEVLKEAQVLEGSVRGTGVHAAGIIIAPDDLTTLIPVAVAKDSDLLLTQYEGNVIENAGVIKMDFLGLKTLTIIRDALAMIKEIHNVELDLDAIPLDDAKTFELYQKGETNGTFQFESAGMQKYLKDLKPDKFEDLIAMNALYRPGPLEYIPNFIKRKHGKEAISYDLPAMEEYLSETYGITVYQEQVMLLSQSLAGFTKGEADTLRKAMGKKQKEVLDKMKSKFVEGAITKGHPADKLEKVWTDWEAFASYAFNKSHSTCYAFVAYQTAFLKAHYPAEYMASVLTHNQSDIEKVSFFMDECRRMGIPVLGPDVNESKINFAVTKKGEIRFGMAAIKGVGEGAVQELIKERTTNGYFSGLFDLSKRVSSKAVNKRVLEALVKAGAFDFDKTYHRAQYLLSAGAADTGIELAIKFGARFQEQQASSQASLFGVGLDKVELPEPKLPEIPPLKHLDELKLEKEVVGMFISKHPLDLYEIEAKAVATHSCADLSDPSKFPNQEVNIAGMVTSVKHLKTKQEVPFGKFTIEDYSGEFELTLYRNDYAQSGHLFLEDTFVHIKLKITEKNSFNPEDQRKFYSFSVLALKQLNEYRERGFKGLEIIVPFETVTEQLIQKLEKNFVANKGNTPIVCKLVDTEKNLKLDLTSEYKVLVSKSLFDELENLNLNPKVVKN